jgi:ubiquinone/menaquinone biosynthesis C-methylase UbiE
MKTVVEKHFNQVALTYDRGKRQYGLYYSTLKEILQKNIIKNKKVFEFGCGTGNLLASLSVKRGFGMDISSEMINIARRKHKGKKNLEFSTSWPNEKFDYIFMCDVIEHLTDPRKEFNKIVKLMPRKSTFINTMANPIWEPILMLWEKLGLKMKEGPHKRISYLKLKNIIEQSGMKVIMHEYKLLLPVNIPFVTFFINKYIERYFKKYAFIEYVIAQKV